MEEVLVERTIKVLVDYLDAEMALVWTDIEGKLEKLDPMYQKNLTLPFIVDAQDFFRFSLDERPSVKNHRFIISCQRTIADTTDRSDLASGYDLEVIFMYDYTFDGKSRYYIPMRVREAIINALQKHSRLITGRSSYFSVGEINTAEMSDTASRTVLCGVQFKTII